jgi:hypothetical protein
MELIDEYLTEQLRAHQSSAHFVLSNCQIWLVVAPTKLGILFMSGPAVVATGLQGIFIPMLDRFCNNFLFHPIFSCFSFDGLLLFDFGML